MKTEVQKYLEKAEHGLVVAKDLMDKGHPSDAASKIYYSMFYAAQALLRSENIDMVKHSAVESAFGYYFVKSGKINLKFHKMLINARKIREIADYDIQEEIVEPVASLKLKEGKDFLLNIKRYLKVQK